MMEDSCIANSMAKQKSKYGNKCSYNESANMVMAYNNQKTSQPSYHNELERGLRLMVR